MGVRREQLLFHNPACETFCLRVARSTSPRHLNRYAASIVRDGDFVKVRE